jgi:hypothetical protein
MTDFDMLQIVRYFKLSKPAREIASFAYRNNEVSTSEIEKSFGKEEGKKALDEILTKTSFLIPDERRDKYQASETLRATFQGWRNIL